MAHWSEVAGVGPWFYIERAPIHHFEYRGRPYEIHLSIALANSGALQLELIEQRNDVPSLYREFLDAGNEGLQHIAYWTERFDADRARALEADSWSDTRGGSATTARSPTSTPTPTRARSSSCPTWAVRNAGSSSTSGPLPRRGTGGIRFARSRPTSPDREHAARVDAFDSHPTGRTPFGNLNLTTYKAQVRSVAFLEPPTSWERGLPARGHTRGKSMLRTIFPLRSAARCRGGVPWRGCLAGMDRSRAGSPRLHGSWRPQPELCV